MRGMKMLAVCAVLGAGAAGAQELEQQGSAQADASVGSSSARPWSIGGGAGFVVLGTNGQPSGLTPRASLEYLLASDTALVLGGFGSFGSSFANGSSSIDGGIGVNLGLRKFFGSAGPTRFSLHGLANLGFRDSEADDSRVDVGVGGGFAVDRELVDALTLRIAVDVANLGFSRRDEVNRVGLDLFLAPALELRLAF